MGPALALKLESAGDFNINININTLAEKKKSTSTSTLTAKARMTIDSAQVGPGVECVAGEEGDNGLGNHQRGRFANLVRR